MWRPASPSESRNDTTAHLCHCSIRDGFIREVTSAPPCHQQGAVRNFAHNPIWPSPAEVAKVISRYFLPGMFLMAGAALLASPAIAHHSYSMFDIDKSVQVEGTVK